MSHCGLQQIVTIYLQIFRYLENGVSWWNNTKNKRIIIIQSELKLNFLERAFLLIFSPQLHSGSFFSLPGFSVEKLWRPRTWISAGSLLFFSDGEKLNSGPEIKGKEQFYAKFIPINFPRDWEWGIWNMGLRGFEEGGRRMRQHVSFCWRISLDSIRNV